MEARKLRSMKKFVSKWQQLVKKSRYPTSNPNPHPHPPRWILRLLHSCYDPACQDKGRCCCPPRDVPQGFLAVYVGRERKRFVIPAIYLNHPVFRLLLEKAKEEFGFSQKGVLKMPFEVLLFERFLWLVGHDEPTPYELGTDELEKYYMEKYHLSMKTIPIDD